MYRAGLWYVSVHMYMFTKHVATSMRFNKILVLVGVCMGGVGGVARIVEVIVGTYLVLVPHRMCSTVLL